mgnify:CR=1 FL=1
MHAAAPLAVASAASEPSSAAATPFFTVDRLEKRSDPRGPIALCVGLGQPISHPSVADFLKLQGCHCAAALSLNTPPNDPRVLDAEHAPAAPAVPPPLAQTPFSTFSIVARDPVTGDLGVAVQSHWFAVGAGVTWAEPGVGAIATQSFAEPAYGRKGLERMRAGTSAPDALAALLAEDAKRDVLTRFERDYFAALSEESKGNVSEMARRAGMERAHVRAYLRRHGISAKQDPQD